MYIHEQAYWLQFIWNQKRLALLIVELLHEQGRLVSGMESIEIEGGMLD